MAGGRRAELDGVRGVAIVLVLVGHSNRHLQPLGAVGVSVFFTLSGYLITSLLVAEQKRRGLIDMRRFYLRRFTRLAPPLFAMLLVLMPFAGHDWPHMLAPAMWLSNYATLLGFNVAPFPHTWSLGVEEQFYLIWPFAVLWLLRRRRPVGVLLAITAALVSWRLLLTCTGYYVYAYMAPETAGVAVLAGCLLALSGVRPRRSRASVSLASVVIAGAVACGFETAAASAVASLVVVPAAVTLVASASDAPWLRWRPLAFCGVTSYSLYLWHVPVSLAVGTVPAGVIVGTAVGLLAYMVVERPLMQWRAPSPLGGTTGPIARHMECGDDARDSSSMTFK